MNKTGAEVLVDCLLAQGVDTAFGVPGESYLAVLDALYEVSDRIRLIPNRHEGGAAFMAESWGKLTGAPGVAFVTRGPGATNAAIGVHTAMQNSTPMLLFIGQVDTGMKGREAFQEIDYRAFFGPIAKWAVEVEDPDLMAETVARAFAVAQSGRPGPVAVALPENVLTAVTERMAGPRVRVPEPAPSATDVAEAARLLAAAERPVMLVGGGGWRASGRAALDAFARAAGLPVLTVFRYRDLFDNHAPQFCGDAGLAKPAWMQALITGADLLLAVNVRFGEIATDGWTLLEPPRAGPKLVHVHPGARELNKIYTADLPIQSGPNAFMAALRDAAVPPRRAWAERAAAARAQHEASLRAPPQPGALDMGEVIGWLQANLPEDAILTNGAGNFAIWPNRHFAFGPRQRLLAPQSGAMGYGLPAAIAAKVAHPEACVVCFAGDGDFQMTCAELGAALQSGARPIVLVLNNSSYGTIRMHQERAYPGRVSFTDIENPDFVALARAYGFHAERVRETSEFAAAFGRAQASSTGALLELVVDVEALTPRATLSAIRAEARRGLAHA